MTLSPCLCPRCTPNAHVHHCGWFECTGECRRAEGEPTLHLGSSSLLSKYGFDDGVIPDQVLDYLDEHGMAYPDDWHRILVRLVRIHLLPELLKHHVIEVEEIDAHHNPIRARSVDGVSIDTDLPASITLMPAYVLVPMAAVAREIQKGA